MTLNEKISRDMKDAMKSGEKVRVETLRTLRAALLEKEVEKRPAGTITPEDEMAVLISASKKRKEAIDLFRKNGRDDLADQEEQELGIIQTYLPRQLTVEEIEQVVRQKIAEVGATSSNDFGRVMPLVMKELKGKGDGRIIQESVRKLLGEQRA